MLRNKDLNLLPIFDALVKEGKLSKAADTLCMSQPAVSNALKRLRHAFGDDLFVRTRQGLVPTDRALEIHALIGPALDMVGQSFDREPFDPRNSQRTFDISLNTALENYVLANVVVPIRELAPGLRFRFHPDHIPDIPARLRDGRLSYAIEYFCLPDDQFESVVLVNEKLVVVCASNHPTLGTGISLEQYQTLPHLSLYPRSNLQLGDGSSELTPVEQIMGAELPPRNVEMFVTSVLSIPPVVATTDMIATVGMNSVKPWIDRGAIKVLKAPFAARDYNLSIYWHKSRSKDASHEWLMENVLARTPGQA